VVYVTPQVLFDVQCNEWKWVDSGQRIEIQIDAPGGVHQIPLIQRFLLTS